MGALRRCLVGAAALGVAALGAAVGVALAVAFAVALAVAFGAACRTPAPAARREVTGTLTVDGVPAEIVRCRPGHDDHIFVEVDTSLGVLGFRRGTVSWNGRALTCEKVNRSWGGGFRSDGQAYFRGSLALRCGAVVGDLTLDCGQITPEEGAELERNRAEARGQPVSPASGQDGGAKENP